MVTTERREPQPAPIENRGTFAARLRPIYAPEEFNFGMAIYDATKDAHKGKWRAGKERQFEHPRRATITSIELGVVDPDINNGIIMHDTGEDTHLLGPFEAGMTNSEWRETARWRLVNMYGGERVAEIVLTLTKPFIDGVEIKTKDEQEQAALHQLIDGSFEALFAKMTDRDDNLRTLHFRTRENQERKMKETEDLYFPVFERGLQGPYAGETAILLDRMKAQIALNRERLAQMGPVEAITELDEFEKRAFTELVAGVPVGLTRETYKYDTDLIEQTREDIAARLGAQNELDAVRLLLETGLLTYEDVNERFNPLPYQTFTGRQRQFIDALIDPKNLHASLDEIARHLKKRTAKELRREQDVIFSRLRVKNKFQLLAVVHYVRQIESPDVN